MTTQKPVYPIRYDLDPNRVLRDDDDWTLKGRPRCHGWKATGPRCGSFAGYSGFCNAHEPDGRMVKSGNSRTGPYSRGANKLMKLIPTQLRPVFEKLVGAMQDVYTGAITPSQATALAALATASVRVLMAGELEQRLRALDAATITDGEALEVSYDDD